MHSPYFVVLLDKLFSAKVLCSDAPFSKAGIQNIMVLLRHAQKPAPVLGMVKAKPGRPEAYLRLQALFFTSKK
jgi:hypothetical protein